MMDIHHIHIYWTSVIFINYGHPHCGFHNIWFLSYMTDIYHIWRTLTLYDRHHHLLSNSNSDPYTLLSGPSLASKPLQEHKLIIMMELHHCWLSSTLLFIFQIKIYNCKIDSSHDKMELLELSGKVWYRPVTAYIHRKVAQCDATLGSPSSCCDVTWEVMGFHQILGQCLMRTL